jgi:hypothetical protein
LTTIDSTLVGQRPGFSQHRIRILQPIVLPSSGKLLIYLEVVPAYKAVIFNQSRKGTAMKEEPSHFPRLIDHIDMSLNEITIGLTEKMAVTIRIALPMKLGIEAEAELTTVLLTLETFTSRSEFA